MTLLTSEILETLSPGDELLTWNRADFSTDAFVFVGRHPKDTSVPKRWIIASSMTAQVVRFDFDAHRPSLVWLTGEWNDDVLAELDKQELLYQKDKIERDLQRYEE